MGYMNLQESQLESAVETIPVADERITRRLIGRLKQMISSGELVPGCKLPPERELAKHFGVNRASLRQVLKVLEIMGVLSQRVGAGTYLNESSEAILDEPLDFLILIDDLSHHELIETRCIFEPELARLAASRASPEDLKIMKQAIVSLENSTTLQQRLRADIDFHQAVLRAAGNRISEILFRVIHKTIVNSMVRLSARSHLDRPISFHKEVYAAIANHDGDMAARKMLAHIKDAHRVIQSTAAKVN